MVGGDGGSGGLDLRSRVCVGGSHAGARRAGWLLKDFWDCSEKRYVGARDQAGGCRPHTQGPFLRLEEAEA